MVRKKASSLAKSRFSPNMEPYERLYYLSGITSKEEYAEVIQALVQLKITYDGLEEQRKKLKAPTLEAGRTIDREFKPATAPLKKYIEKLKEHIVEYEYASRQERVKQLTDGVKDRAKAADLALKLNEEPDISTLHENISFRRTPEVVVNDISQVPREYLKVDEDRLLDDFKKGYISEVPGLEIKLRFSPAVYVNGDADSYRK